MAIATASPPKSLTPRKVQNFSNNNNTIHNDNSVGTAAVLAQEPESRNSYRIWWSDIVVKNPNNVFVTKRRWEYLDIRALVVMSIMHVLVMFGPMTFSWPTFWVYVILVLPTGFAIPLSYHRQLSHKSFRLPKWLEYFFAYLGVLAQQGDPIEWVSRHRVHHKFGDSERDPHSPNEGFWFSYMNWIFDHGAVARKCGEPNNVQDLEKQAFYRFLRSTYLLHTTAFGLLLYALGGFPYIVWGMGIRTITIFHMTFSVNAICHTWGKQAYNTGDWSRNNWWMAIATIGESWHNNHHAFEYSARHGLEWWEIDATWYTIKLLAALGLATDIKLPTEAHKQRLAFKH